MSTPVFAPADYLDLKQTDHAAIFDGVTQAWEVLPKLGAYILEARQAGQPRHADRRTR